uniref:Uncharacterized protein n=1 Tax=Trichogramma kaykai TaxID=54128 RepID=A0ABD2XRC3_9HYME
MEEEDKKKITGKGRCQCISWRQQEAAEELMLYSARGLSRAAESRMVAIESWVFKVERILANDKNLLSIDSRATYQEVILIVEKLGESLKLHKGITSETLDPSNKAQRKALKQMTRDRTFFVNEISRLGPRMTSARRNAGQLIEKFKGVSSMSATPTKLHAYLSLYYIVDIIDMMREEAVELDRILQLIMIELPRLERNVPFWDRIRL